MGSADANTSTRRLAEARWAIISAFSSKLRLAIEGVSMQTGRPPAWLEKAVELTFSGLETGSTILDIEAPTLGEVLGDELQQQDFWTKPPAASDTALSLFSRSVQDTTAENLESEYYDSGVLRGLLALKPFFKTEAKSVELIAKGRPEENITLTAGEMEKAERLKVRTPEPQAFVVSGRLDAIQHSRKRFYLVLPNGQIIPGQVSEEFISAEQLRQHWGQDVTIKGTVHFKPSGRIQLLEGQVINLKTAGDEVFAEMPVVQTEAEFVASAFQAAEKKDWLKEVWGKWPGDESIEELLAELKR